MSKPWMPLYVGDYLADTAHLRTIEHGGYLLLLMHYWRTGGLPSDDAVLGRIARMTVAEWKRAKPAIELLFLPGWKHKRVEFELTEAARLSTAGRTGGNASAEARKRKRSTNDEATTVERNLNGHTNDPSTNGQALQSPSQSPSKEKKDSGAVAPTAGRSKREKKYATGFPDAFQPNWEAGTRVGLSHREAEREHLKFKNHAEQTGRTCVSWQAAWSNWCINAAQYLKKPPPGHSSQAAVTITPEARSWNAWKSHFRDNNDNVRAAMMDRCGDECRPFTVASEWPPGHEMTNAA